MKPGKSFKAKAKAEAEIEFSGKNAGPENRGSVARLSSFMAIICAVIGFVLYINTIGNDYAIDDDTVIQKNTIVTKGVSAIPEIFTTAYRKGFWDRKEAMYRPLSLAMFAAEWQMAPGKPWLSHLMNILIYSLTGFVLFITLRIVLSAYDILIPFFAALLFLAHPVHTEVVANIKSRDELLAFLFLILSLYFLFRYIRNERKKVVLIVLSLFSFLLALFSKESAITFVAVYPLALYFFSDLKPKEILRNSLLFIIPLAAYFLFRFNAIGTITNKLEVLPINNSLVTATNLPDRIATAILILGKYLGLLIFPHPLSFDYSLNQIPVVSFGNSWVIMTILLYLSLLIFSIKKFLEKNILSFCILFFIITISLVSNIVFMIESTMAERFLYTSSLAFAVGVSFLLVKLLKGKTGQKSNFNLSSIVNGNIKLSLVMLAILLLYSVKTISRNSYWLDNLTLLEKDIKTCPNSCRIRFSYGATLLMKKALKEKDEFRKEILLDKSIESLEKGVAILQTFSDAYFHLGLAYTEKKNYAKAAENFDAALRSKEWNDVEFFVSAGLAYHLAGQCDKALAEFNRAVQVDPKKTEAYSNWGLCLTESGKNEEAIKKLDIATGLSPDFAVAWYNKGNAYARLGMFEAAIKNFEKTLSIDPSYIDALINIGNCYGSMQKPNEAIIYFNKVLAIDPGNVKALSNIVVTYKVLGDEKKAEEYFQKLPRQN